MSADEVDEIVADWSRERPDLDVSPMAVLSRITRLSHVLDRARREAFAGHDVVVWEFDVLAALRRAGAPYELSPKQLIAETLVTSGTMTTRVDRLIERGFVSRHRDPADGRSILVRLTDEGRRAVDGAMEDLLAAEAAMVQELGEDGQEHLAGLLRELILANPASAQDRAGRSTPGSPRGR